MCTTQELTAKEHGADCINYGSVQIHYLVNRSSRKTLAVTVRPDGTVQINAPINSTANQIAERVKMRAGWIIRQQDRFQRLNIHTISTRRYVSGETHYYLGRQYRLRLEEVDHKLVVFKAGRIFISTPDKENKDLVSQQLKAWYRQRASYIILTLFKQCLFKLPIEEERKQEIQVRLVEMNRRWGSCSASGIVRLNPDLIRVPKACIEYIIWHELAHLLVPYHNKKFYEMQDRLMPDWRLWEERLRLFNPL